MQRKLLAQAREEPPQATSPRTSIYAVLLCRRQKKRIAELSLVLEELGKSGKLPSKGPKPARQVARYSGDYHLKKRTEEDYTQTEETFQQAEVK